MRKKILKALAAIVLALLLGAGGWLTLNWSHIRDLADMNSSWYAQNMCSCLFVTLRKESACRDYVRQILPYKSIVIDRKKKTVTATGTWLSFWSQNTSRYEGPRYGCRLVPRNGSTASPQRIKDR